MHQSKTEAGLGYVPVAHPGDMLLQVPAPPHPFPKYNLKKTVVISEEHEQQAAVRTGEKGRKCHPERDAGQTVESLQELREWAGTAAPLPSSREACRLVK